MTVDKIRPYFLLAILLGAALLTFVVFQPFLAPLALAGVFAVVLYPTFRHILSYMPKYRAPAAVLTVIFGVIVILMPLFLLGFLIFAQATALYAMLSSEGGRAYVENTVQSIIAFVAQYVPQVAAMQDTIISDLQTYATTALSFVVSNLGAVVSSITGLLLALFIFFIALYYLLKDGAAFKRFIVALSPLADNDDEAVFKRLEQSVNSVIKGNLSVALAQAVVSGIGFTVFGLPNPVLWAVVLFFSAMVPGVGTALVLVPAILFLFLTGSTMAGVGLLVWGMLAVGLIDNFLGPKLIGRGIRLHPLLILLSVLGGLAYFGPIGLFLGPLTVSLLFALLSIYTESSKSA